jgi:Icc protein
MKQIAWITDIHLNFLKLPEVEVFYQKIAEREPCALLVGGDIGDANSIKTYLQIFEDRFCCPIYFVLGNHDFYHGSIKGVRLEMEKFSIHTHRLHWLPSAGIVPLSKKTCLIGCESWADGRLGNYKQSRVMLNDYLLIKELNGLDPDTRLDKLKSLADKAAVELGELLPQALDCFEYVIILTHVPPFRDACCYEGKISGDDWLPHFSCKSVGDVLLKIMPSYSDRSVTVLCGHTHDAGQIKILPNLHVRIGGAEYGNPCLQDMLEVK